MESFTFVKSLATLITSYKFLVLWYICVSNTLYLTCSLILFHSYIPKSINNVQPVCQYIIHCWSVDPFELFFLIMDLYCTPQGCQWHLMIIVRSKYKPMLILLLPLYIVSTSWVLVLSVAKICSMNQLEGIHIPHSIVSQCNLLSLYCFLHIVLPTHAWWDKLVCHSNVLYCLLVLLRHLTV